MLLLFWSARFQVCILLLMDVVVWIVYKFIKSFELTWKIHKAQIYVYKMVAISDRMNLFAGGTAEIAHEYPKMNDLSICFYIIRAKKRYGSSKSIMINERRSLSSGPYGRKSVWKIGWKKIGKIVWIVDWWFVCQKQPSEKEENFAFCDAEKERKFALRDRITIKKSVRSYCRTRAGYIGCFSAKIQDYATEQFEQK